MMMISRGLLGMLRIEGMLELAVLLVLFAHAGGSWSTFALAFLAPDLALAGYLAGPRVGAAAYNATHSYAGPALAGLAGLLLAPATLPFALIWASHIAFDRTLGYGLKSRQSFRETHLGLVGHARA